MGIFPLLTYDIMSVSEPTCLHDWRTANGEFDHDSCEATESAEGARHDIMNPGSVRIPVSPTGRRA